MTEQAPRRIGMYGGSFDPIHVGHVATAIAVREAFSLCQLEIIPTNRSPFKRPTNASSADRAEMVRLATKDLPWVVVSTFEIDREPPSYSIDTVLHLRAKHPRARLYLVVGADAFQEFAGWRAVRDVVAYAEIIVVARDGTALSVPPRVNMMISDQLSRVHFLAVDTPAVSSREVRSRWSTGQSIDGLVAPDVQAYLRDHGLYTPIAETGSGVAEAPKSREC